MGMGHQQMTRYGRCFSFSDQLPTVYSVLRVYIGTTKLTIDEGENVENRTVNHIITYKNELDWIIPFLKI